MYTVYVHKNLKNEKYYVGCTKMNPKKRWDNGRGYKNQPKMWADIQNSDWNKDWVHGILGKFENEKDALKYEAFLIAMLGTIENGYNTSSYGSGDFKHSEETKKKISKAHIGKHHTEESKKKISEATTGENNPMFGKHHSEESKKKMSNALKGNINAPTKSVIQYSINGDFLAEYPSSHEAERQVGCDKSSICKCCKGKRKSCGGYIWKYKD